MLRVNIRSLGTSLLFVSILSIALSEFNVLNASVVQLSLPQIFSIMFLLFLVVCVSATQTKAIEIFFSSKCLLVMLGLVFFFYG